MPSDHQTEGHQCSTHPSALMVELREHIPFSVSAVAIGLIVAGAICILGGRSASQAHDSTIDHQADQGHVHVDESEPQAGGHEHESSFARLFFHLFHPAHMLFSAAATAAMFMRYERKTLKALVIGLVGAIGVCGVSDIAVPHVSVLFLGVAAPWHVCVVEHPEMTLPMAGVGVLIGIATAGGHSRSTIVSHSLHVLASTMASIFYMVGPLGVTAWIDRIGLVFLFVVVAVVIPCCVSDIVWPMLMTKAGRRKYEHEPHVH